MGTATLEQNDLAIKTPADLEQECPAFLVWAKALNVSGPAEYQIAADNLKDIKSALKRVEDFFKPMKKSADETKRKILDAERKLTVPLNEAEQLAKQAMLAYQRAEDAKRLAEQRKLQAEADERARREREALAKKAAAAKKPETRERYQEAAAAVVAPVVSVASQTPAVTGLTTRKVWKARVVDAAKVPRDFLAVDERKLDQYAKAMRDAASVPGVEFYQEEILASKGS